MRLRVAFFSSMPFGAFKSNSCQIVLAHALDLETAVNFDRHTSVVAPYCTCLGCSKCEIRPWVESSGFKGGGKSSEIACRMAIENKIYLAMVVSGERQHSASGREDAGEQATKVSWVWGVGKGI